MLQDATPYLNKLQGKSYQSGSLSLFFFSPTAENIDRIQRDLQWKKKFLLQF